MMQIYLPYSDIKLNVSVLEERELTHQRNCALTILETIAGKAKGWQWHPGVFMWYGWEDLLAHIAIRIEAEWAEQVSQDPRTTPAGIRGIDKQYQDKLRDLGFNLLTLQHEPELRPWWWGNVRFHHGNQSVLLRKDTEWYGQFFTVENNLCDWWPKQEVDTWIYGPQRGPDGDYAQYFIDDKPIMRSAGGMSDEDFAHHANVYHNLMPGGKTPLTKRDAAVMVSLRTLHDRFHQKRVYTTHDHW